MNYLAFLSGAVAYTKQLVGTIARFKTSPSTAQAAVTG